MEPGAKDKILKGEDDESLTHFIYALSELASTPHPEAAASMLETLLGYKKEKHRNAGIITILSGAISNVGIWLVILLGRM